MQNRLFAIFIVAMFSISSLTACATQIGNKCSLEQTAFEVGRSTKNDVANTLGLPVKMKTDGETGTEYWAYRENPALASVMFPVVDGPLSASVHSFHIPGAYGDQFQEAAVIYAFNKEGVLIDVADKRK